MLHMILADAELELVPAEIINHAQVRQSAQKRGKSPGKMLLDTSFHHQAMRPLAENDRRGRPDIAHFFLLLCQDSIANQQGNMRCYVHTRHDEVVSVEPHTNLPKNQMRFTGLIESLFQDGAVPNASEPLLRIARSRKLSSLIAGLKVKRTILMDPAGALIAPSSLFTSGGDGDTAVVIGGFPDGAYRSDFSKIPHERVSIHNGMLKVWTVTAEVLCAYHAAHLNPAPETPKA